MNASREMRRLSGSTTMGEWPITDTIGGCQSDEGALGLKNKSKKGYLT